MGRLDCQSQFGWVDLATGANKSGWVDLAAGAAISRQVDLAAGADKS